MPVSPFNKLNPLEPRSQTSPLFSGPVRDSVNAIPECGSGSETIDLYSSLTDSASNLLGVRILYWRYDYKKESDHSLFEEDTDAEYLGPYALQAVGSINSDDSLLGNFGIEGTNDVDLYISFPEWERVFGKTAGPIAKDVFTFRDILCPPQAPSGHTSIYFELASQGDGDLTSLFMGQKYHWVLSGKRFDFSWQPNAPVESISDQVFKNTHQGPIEDSGDPENPTREKGDFSVDNNIMDDIAKDDFDSSSKNGIFGKYYSESVTVTTTPPVDDDYCEEEKPPPVTPPLIVTDDEFSFSFSTEFKA